MPSTTASDDWNARVRAWVERACVEQGVPVKVTDPFILAEVAEILCSAREKRKSDEKVARLGRSSRMSRERPSSAKEEANSAGRCL